MENAFGRSAPFTVGIEEEFQVVSAESYELVPRFDDVAEAASDERVRQELMTSVLEAATGIHATVGEAIAEAREIRGVLRDAAAQRRALIVSAGTHPFSRWEHQEITQAPRYQGLVEELRWVAEQVAIFGLHVHIGMPDAQTCFRVMETILPWLPVVLALSANSPYFECRETGMLSIRAEILGILPRHGAPPPMRSYEEWEHFIARVVAAGVAADYTSFWWDIRPHPRFGTLEIRAPDQPTALERTAAFVRLVRDLCAWALDAPARPFDPAERGVYDQNRWAASRFGPHGQLIHPDRNEAWSVDDLLGELPVTTTLAADWCEADRQLEIGRANGLHAVCADLVDMSNVMA